MDRPAAARFDKTARFLAQSARFEAGQVLVPSTRPGSPTWMSELLAFPNGRHDDQVDSTSQALDHLAQHSFARQHDGTPRVRPAGRPRPQGIQRPLGHGPALRHPRALEEDREVRLPVGPAARVAGLKGERRGYIAFRAVMANRVLQALC